MMSKSPVSSYSGMSTSAEASASLSQMPTQDLEDDLFFLSTYPTSPATSLDLLQLSATWQNQLDELSHNNANSLLKVSERAQNIIPSVTKAVDELSAFERIMAEYTERVRSLSRELQQIETVSNTQSTQIQNLVLLKGFIESEIISDFEDDGFERDLLEGDFEEPKNVPYLAKAANNLYKVINTERLAIRKLII